MATWIMASETLRSRSWSRMRRRQRTIQPKVRSITHRRALGLQLGMDPRRAIGAVRDSVDRADPAQQGRIGSVMGGGKAAPLSTVTGHRDARHAGHGGNGEFGLVPDRRGERAVDPAAVEVHHLETPPPRSRPPRPRAAGGPSLEGRTRRRWWLRLAGRTDVPSGLARRAAPVQSWMRYMASAGWLKRARRASLVSARNASPRICTSVR